VLSWVLSTKMLPAVGALIPLIVIYKRVGLFDSRLGMILLYGAFNLPLVIWMMRSFFADLPREILEAAVVDGARFVRIMTRIILPLSAPGLAATILLSLIFSWNEFLLAVNLTSSRSGTLPVFISSFMTSEGLFWAKMSAASTLAVAPVILAGWLAQRSLVRGLTFGAVK
jgi:sorbitol/mannitol transport system permease protein